MFHRVVRPIACCLLLSWGVLAAPRKEDLPPAYYHPSMVGDKLVFEQDYGDHSKEWVLEVTDARQKGVALIVTIRGTKGEGTPGSFQYEVSTKGVFKVATEDAVLEPPECFLRLPFKKGDTWETTRTQDGETYTTKYTVGDQEEVEVRAVKFRCVRLESKFVFKGVSCTVTDWMAPRCGMVKEVLVGTDEVGTEYARTTVLKSFAPGGK